MYRIVIFLISSSLLYAGVNLTAEQFSPVTDTIQAGNESFVLGSILIGAGLHNFLRIID